MAAHLERDDQAGSILGDLSSDRETTHREIKSRLGKLLGDGEALMRLRDDELSARKWVTEVHDLIKHEFGDGEANLFLSDAGYTFFVSDKRGRINVWLEGRIRRLTDLIRRV